MHRFDDGLVVLALLWGAFFVSVVILMVLEARRSR